MSTNKTQPTWNELTGFRRDLIQAIADVENDDRVPYGLALKREMESNGYDEVNHSRLYTNLDDLVNKGLVERGEVDRRTNSYPLTQRGQNLLQNHARSAAETAGLDVVGEMVADGGQADE